MSLILESVSHRFGAQTVLDDVSVHVRRGEVYGLIGHNGAGKTTLLRIALGLIRPRRGRVLVDGFLSRRHPREARARVGGLIEVTGFHGSWSARRNLTVLGRLQGLDESAARAEADRVLDRVGLADVGAKPVRAFSQGMGQRLGIGQALLGNPDYILLDEPTNGLDPEGIAEMRELLRALARDENRAVLVSSHALQELASLCHRVGFLRRGVLLRESDTATLLADEAVPYVVHTDDDARAATVLRALGLAPVEGTGGELRATLGQRSPGEVAGALIAAGLSLETFAKASRNLEDVYLELARDPDAARDAAPAAPTATPAAGKPDPIRAPRRPVLRVLRYEGTRLGRAASTWFVMAIPALAALIQIVQRSLEAKGLLREVETDRLASAENVTAFAGVTGALQAGLPVLAIVVAAMASQSLSGEFARGTLRNVALRPVTRFQIILGKLVAVLGYGAAAYGLLLAAAVGGATWAFDFTDVKEILPNGQEYVYLEASTLWPDFRRMLVSPLLPLLPYAGLGFLVGTLTRRPVAAISLTTGLVLVLDLGRGLARAFDLWQRPRVSAEACMPSSYLPSPFGDSSFVEYYRQTLDQSNAVYRFLGTDASVPLAWFAAAVILSALVFFRRSLP